MASALRIAEALFVAQRTTALRETRPTPGSWITRLFRMFAEGPTGMAVNYEIYLEASQATNPSLLVHELTHVAQFERLGGVEAFLREYILQCVRDGYWEADLEREARVAAAPFSRPPGG